MSVRVTVTVKLQLVEWPHPSLAVQVTGRGLSAGQRVVVPAT